jgi:hypothetical protein
LVLAAIGGPRAPPGVPPQAIPVIDPRRGPLVVVAGGRGEIVGRDRGLPPLGDAPPARASRLAQIKQPSAPVAAAGSAVDQASTYQQRCNGRSGVCDWHPRVLFFFQLGRPLVVVLGDTEQCFLRFTEFEVISESPRFFGAVPEFVD